MRQLLHHYIWLQLGKPPIDDIGRKFASEINASQLLANLVKLYVNVSIDSAYQFQRAMLMYREGLFDFEESPLEFTLPAAKEGEKLELANIIKMLEALVEILFSGEGPEQDALLQEAVVELPESIQQLLFYRTWWSFGCLMGVHYDFGRHSFLHIQGELKPHYFSNQENRVQTVCKLIEDLNNF